MDKIKQAFDFQKFEHNEKLDSVIQSTLESVNNKLSDEELDMVNAAYTAPPFSPNSDKKEKNPKGF